MNRIIALYNICAAENNNISLLENKNSLFDLTVKRKDYIEFCGATRGGTREIDRLHHNGCCSCFGY